MNNFFSRTLTGAGIVIFVLGGFWLHPLSFFITGLIVLAGVQYEYYRIVSKSGIKPSVTAGMITGITAYTLATLAAAGIIEPGWLLFLMPLYLVVIFSRLYINDPKPFDSLAHTIFPFLYTVLPFSLFPFSAYSKTGLETIMDHNMVFSPGAVIGFFLIIWVNDTGAYLTGITFGKHKLFERVSPKKTWEGFFGGMILAVAGAGFLSSWLGVTGRLMWMVIAVVVSVAGTYGDLVESMLKRSAGVKDSGTILPGHGGILDRFDSTLTAFPLVYLLITLFA